MKLDKNYKVRVTPEQSRQIQELVFKLGGKWNSDTDWVINEIIPFLYITSGLVMTCDSKSQEYFGYASSENTEILATELIAKLEQLTKNDKTMKLDDFLKCKKVRCVKGCGGHLTVGETYHVLGLSVPNNLVQIENDNGFITEYDFEKFEPVIDSAENPLQNIELTPEYEAVEPVLADNGVNTQDIGTDILDTNADIKDTPKFKVGDKVYYRAYADICVVSDVSDLGEVQIKGWREDYYNSKYFCHATQENYEMLCNLYPHIEFEQPPTQEDIDNEAVDKLAQAMKEKLAKKREQGYHGWETCKHGDLVQLLINHVDKGDPIDVANFCAFLFARGEPLTEAVLDE